MMTLYVISVVLSLAILFWAMYECSEHPWMYNTNVGSMLVAAAGFAIVPFLNVIPAFVLASMVLETKDDPWNL